MFDCKRAETVDALTHLSNKLAVDERRERVVLEHRADVPQAPVRREHFGDRPLLLVRRVAREAPAEGPAALPARCCISTGAICTRAPAPPDETNRPVVRAMHACTDCQLAEALQRCFRRLDVIQNRAGFFA